MSRPFLILLALLPSLVQAGDLVEQRKLYGRALPHAEAGDWPAVSPYLKALEGYPLLPDLRAAWLAARLGRVEDAAVSEFLAEYPSLGFSGPLRYDWALSLARRGEWSRYLEFYDASYRNSTLTTLHCHALTARIRLARTDGLEEEALRYWMSPVSQPRECDPAFEWLEKRNALTAERRLRRTALALDAGQMQLARWLARAAGPGAMVEVARWEHMQKDPARQLSRRDGWRDEDADRALLLSGFRRLASSEPERAAALWPQFRDRFDFPAGERAALDRRIAMIHAWRLLPGAGDLLAALPEDAHDGDSRAWTVRTLLRAAEWPAALAALEILSEAEQELPVWRYWRARLLELVGRADEARPLYAGLATERGYYSFLSADRLDADYHWRHQGTAALEEVIAAIEARAEVIRARELFYTGQEGRGRIEWQAAVAQFSVEERAQAGLLAARWGWHSRAIAAVSVPGLDDDLELRFPLAWRPVFEDRSRAVGIRSAWAYGVARSESLFMPDVTSSAGAVGVMQLMPAVGRETAHRAGIPYRGVGTLTDPESNVSLGTRYLSSMLTRFGNHEVLATAAYNAGPRRVASWLPEVGTLPADVWVDTVPFSETRAYVQRVLASDAVFQWRLSGETRRLTEAMRPVSNSRDL